MADDNDLESAQGLLLDDAAAKKEWLDGITNTHWERRTRLFIGWQTVKPHADLSSPELENLFHQFDTDGDGYLSVDEITTLLKQVITTASEQELDMHLRIATTPQGKQAFGFKTMTNNKNVLTLSQRYHEAMQKKLDSKEFSPMVTRFMQQVDKKGEGKVGKNEFIINYKRFFQDAREEQQSAWNPNGWKPGTTQEKFNWYQEGARSGDAGAQYRLALMYAGEDGYIQVGRTKTARRRLKEKKFKGDDALDSSGSLISREGRTAQFKWLVQAARQMHTAAMYRLAVMFSSDEVPEECIEAGIQADKNYPKRQAAKWYQRAAEKGHDRSAVALARLLLEGDGIKQDTKASLKWLSKAGIKTEPAHLHDVMNKAKEGDASAANDLAINYMIGTVFFPRSYPKAFKWFRKAAERHHVDSLWHVGNFYRFGMEAVKPDVRQMISYWSKAAKGKHRKARKALAEVKSAAKKAAENRGACARQCEACVIM